MASRETIQHALKRDQYVSSHGGNSHFLDIYCSKCNHNILLYQKDGKGRLLRAYLDRIFEPENLSSLASRVHSKQDMPSLKCLECNTLIGTPMIYIPERRLAYRLIYGSFIKKKSEGVYPPKEDD